MSTVVAIGISVLTAVISGSAGARTERPITAVATPTPHQIAMAAYARMSARERVGELFMAGLTSSGATATQISLLSGHDIDDVILANDTTHSQHAVGRYTSKLTADLRVAGVAPFISTDQEGGEVQRLSGKGFSAMPTALRQGKLSTDALRAASRTWGTQLLGAGVDLDLAPVADTVPAKHASANQPIGRFDREFGHTPKVVAPHVVAFVRGMNQAGVDTTVKHFPGLGRASGNTDTMPGVTDPTTRHDPYLKPYRAGISAGTQMATILSWISSSVGSSISCTAPLPQEPLGSTHRLGRRS